MTIDRLFEIITNLNTSTKNLSKDLDKSDPREETKQDLNNINMSFEELGTILSSLTKEDNEAIQREFWELMQGQESFQEYVNDVNKIINNVRARAKQDPTVQKKLEANMPEEATAEDAPSLFQGYQQMFSQVAQLISSVQKANR
jgi:hypothetical protein